VALRAQAGYRQDNFQELVSSALALLLILSFIYPCSRLIQGVVLEKERKIKEGMKMMSLTDGAFYGSWLLTSAAQAIVTSAVVTLVACNGSSRASVFLYSDPLLVFLYFLAFTLSLTTLCFFLSSFFSQSKVAAGIGTLGYFAFWFPSFAVGGQDISGGVKTFASLFSPTAFSLGTAVFADFESGQVGVRWGNMNEVSVGANYSFGTCLRMMFLDYVLYGLLAWYLDKVLKNEFGTARSKCFCFGFGESGPVAGADERYAALEASMASGGGDDGDDLKLSVSDGTGGKGGGDSLEGMVESVPPNLKLQEAKGSCLQIQGLLKSFPSGTAGRADKVAVNRLHLCAYEGQITALLGHNGAGKTTTINMLTGLMVPSGGDARVAGKSLRRDMPQIRTQLGVCPQHDILFDELTVREHLALFAVLKGVPEATAESEIGRWIGVVGLTEKADVPSRSLSGGMKRKLSVAIALVGGSKVVVLDEPTSGMDPYSRRSCWSALQSSKSGRVLLLTTHFMDEADILGDRIAIMADGELRCAGSSLFLKNKYGVGYTLTISLSKVEPATLAAIKRVVLSRVAEATVLSSVGAELSLRLPLHSASRFQSLFEQFDAEKAALGITAYGISVTTLEEVFMRVERGTADLQDQDQLDSLKQSTRELGQSQGAAAAELGNGGAEEARAARASRAEEWGEARVLLQHTSALLRKRVAYAKRDRRALLCQLVIPGIAVLLGLSLLQVSPIFKPVALGLSDETFNPGLAAGLRNLVPANFSSAQEVAGGAEWATGGFAQANATTLQAGLPVSTVSVVTGQNVPVPAGSVGTAGLPQQLGMSAYLLQSTAGVEGGASRYGALLYPAAGDGYNYSNSSADGGGAGVKQYGAFGYAVMCNASAVHGTPLFMNAVNDAKRSAAAGGGGGGGGTIKTSNYPLPKTYVEMQASKGLSALSASSMITISFSLIPASFAIFVVKEREVKAKHQQMISGVSVLAYWGSSFLFDCLSYFVTAGFSIAVILLFGIDAFTTGAGLQGTVALFLLYGPAVAAFTYVVSFAFKTHSSAQNGVLLLNFATGLILSTVAYVLSNLDATRDINNDYLQYVYRLFPTYCLAHGLQWLSFCDGDSCLLYSGGVVARTTPLDRDIVGLDLSYLAVETVVYLALALAIEYAQSNSLLDAAGKLCGRGGRGGSGGSGGDGAGSGGGSGEGGGRSDPLLAGAAAGEEEDEDVARERSRVSAAVADGVDDSGDVVLLSSVRKVYPGGGKHAEAKVAVQGLSFGIPRGECFGFLGINGAGKTTTLSMLTGEFPPSAGSAFIAGKNIVGGRSVIRRQVGYCPQFDAVIDLLTVREHLELYARIKCIPAAEVEGVVRSKLTEMDLSGFEHTVAMALSGGNKRKLSVAIAMIGEPSIVFMDEPSTGMDPVARRFMWEVISRLSTEEGRCSIILTTHSMEEGKPFGNVATDNTDTGTLATPTLAH
jgi:ATP-binding cassette subfamily A (ABC1) protein 3